ncbi:solute carrier family 35 member G1-like protein [Dinothrombium tinctorium]|uniref:Solute carrier family 35 member G1-like protein n=1 Tax=Dinothrombium tinctorium TaxID=1965070 RepID=A0A443R6R2_9ACAR|nr:solute carrier family 35 member G1-like protein [Dinothrombium tinctorium]
MAEEKTQVAANEVKSGENITKRRYVKRMRKVPCLGLFFAFMFAFLMSTSVAIVKLIKGLHALEVLVIRSIIQAVFFGILMWYKKSTVFGHPGERWHVFGRSVSGAINMCGWYLSVKKISLMDSSAIYYSAPVFVVVLASIFLREPFGLFEALSTTLTLIGVLLISRPQFIPFFADKLHPMTNDTICGLLLALLASFTFAMANIHLRKLQKTTTEVNSFWFSIACIVSGVVVVPFIDQLKIPENFTQWLLCLAVGVCGCLGLICFSLSMKIEKAGPVSIVQSSTLVIVLIYQLALFSEPITLMCLIGSFLIGASIVIIGLKDALYTKTIEKLKHKMTSTAV